MDGLAEEARTKPPWAMLFAGDLVLVNETLEDVGEQLERWRAVVDSKGLRISRSKLNKGLPGNISSTVRMRTTAIGKQFQVPCFSNRREWMVWTGCR